MLTGNLATRPFYNERLVRGALIVALAAAVLWTALNVITLVSLSQQSALLSDRIRTEGLRASGARTEADTIRRGLNVAELKKVSGAASEANALIERRTFSWTGLFNLLETTLPPDVRLVEVQPQADNDGRFVLSLTVVSRRIDDLDEFMQNLEGTGAFSGVVSRSDEALEDGTIASTLQGYYALPARSAVAASESSNASATPARTPEAAR
jgi:Tfp pilus assembly protein PilN